VLAEAQTFTMTTKSYTKPLLTLALTLILGLMNTLLAEDFAKKVVVNYYGHALPFSLTNDYFDKQKSIAEGLNIEQQTQLLINDSAVFTFIKEANQYAQTFKLDDIAYLMLVKKAADIITPKNEKYFAQQFTYAVLYNRGLDVILGVSNQSITVYGSTNFAIKNVLFVQLGSKTYYDLSFDHLKEPAQEKLANIKSNLNAKNLKLNRYSPPAIGKLGKNKTIPFEYDDCVYFFTSRINQSLVEYYHDLPDIEMSLVYLNYGLSEKGANTLVNQLKNATAYMSKEKAVNFVLSFVQSLAYAKDMDVLGKEKFAFPEEALANDFSDCEDRSMLFAYLVREVTNLQSIGLLYKDVAHMNVAVENWRKTNGDISVYDMDFVVCEPSAKGYRAGEQTMNLTKANVVKW
jgi:hypothetical protein